MTWTLFEITQERARETRKRLGFLTEEERAEQQRIERAQRPPSPYVETPEHLKRERLAALERRLAQAGDHYGSR